MKVEKLEHLAERIADIRGKCDGGRSYPWKQAADDMERVLFELNMYHPRKPGKQMIRKLLRMEAKGWITVWRCRR